MTDYTLACPECGHDASEHANNKEFRRFGCTSSPASLYAAECAKLDARLAMNAETFRRVQAERDAARALADRYKAALEELATGEYNCDSLCCTAQHIASTALDAGKETDNG